MDVSSPRLKLLKAFAKDIAETTILDTDTSLIQLTKNLVSLIGQKASEMNLLFSLVTLDSLQLKEYYDDIFMNHNGVVALSDVDIEEAAEAVKRSRGILTAFKETREFEVNFQKGKSKIPPSYFHSRSGSFTPETKAMIFAIRYIKDRESQAKNIKQSLKKNCSFRAFATDLNIVEAKLINLGLLIRERREKRLNNNAGVRVYTYYKCVYNPLLDAHKEFLSKFQIIYPGELIA